MILAFKPLNEAQQNDLYQLIAERYEKNSTIITSNRDFDEWPSIFTNPLLGSAALDRLVHRGIQDRYRGSQVIALQNSKRLVQKQKKCNNKSIITRKTKNDYKNCTCLV